MARYEEVSTEHEELIAWQLFERTKLFETCSVDNEQMPIVNVQPCQGTFQLRRPFASISMEHMIGSRTYRAFSNLTFRVSQMTRAVQQLQHNTLLYLDSCLHGTVFRASGADQDSTRNELPVPDQHLQ